MGKNWFINGFIDGLKLGLHILIKFWAIPAY